MKLLSEQSRESQVQVVTSTVSVEECRWPVISESTVDVRCHSPSLNRPFERHIRLPSGGFPTRYNAQGNASDSTCEDHSISAPAATTGLLSGIDDERDPP